MEALRESNLRPHTLKECKLPSKHPLSYMITQQNHMNIYVLIDNLDILTKKRKEHPPQGDDASTAEAAPGRVGRDEQCEAHRANTTPNGGPHLEL